MVYVVLSSHATANDQRCFPSYATIAREGSVARRTAIRAIAELAELRLLVKTARFRADTRSPTSNLYILFPADAPFDPDQEAIDQEGRVVPLEEPAEAGTPHSQVAAGVSGTPTRCPPGTSLVNEGHQPGAPESSTPPHLTRRLPRPEPLSVEPYRDLTRPENETNERLHGDDAPQSVEEARRLADGYREAAGLPLPPAQARQIIAKHGEAYAREKLDLLRWQRNRGGFSSGPLPYYLAALAGDWECPVAESPRSPATPATPLSAEERERETAAEALFATLSLAEKRRLQDEAASAVAAALGETQAPDFVLRTELLRRVLDRHGASGADGSSGAA
jgi:hypothetical protein